MAKITINGITIDPLAPHPTLAAMGMGSSDVSDTNYVLIQLKGPATADQRATLSKAGAELLEYVPENTYLAHFPGPDLSAIQTLPFVAMATGYMTGFKLHPAFVTQGPADAVSLLAAAGAADPLRSRTQRVTVVLHKNIKSRDVLAKIAAAAGVDAESLQNRAGKVALTVTADRLKALSDIDEVRHVEPAPQNSLFNDVAGEILNSSNLHAGMPGLAALDGAGEIVAVCDTGFDKGSIVDTHPAFRGRVLQIDALKRPLGNDPNGHGTHVCGSILGDDNNVAGHGPIRGSAPAARLFMQSALDSDGNLSGIPTDLSLIFSPAYDAHDARIHSNSWGDSNRLAHRQYDGQATDVDTFVHGHRDMVICFAAGNDGVDADRNGVVDPGSVSPPGTAKNCITVGASESERPGSKAYGELRPNSYPVDPLNHDPMANNREGLAAFSSRGTTIDNRIKPDIVAPGTSILSTLSRDATLSVLFGANPPPGYMFDTGTSMATPLVSGCAALVRQHLIRDRGLATPSAALVKALLINGAHPLAGQYVPSEAGTPPNVDQGFGRVDVEASVDPTLILHDEGAPLADTGASSAFQAQTGPNGSLKVTLVWTDPPGLGLQNDLDLVVRTNGAEAHGNVAIGVQDFDRANNVEQVVWDGLPAGAPIAIEVRAFRIALEAQSFALVIRTS